MNKENAFTLIDGTFSTTDSKEILKNVFSSKIHFHQMKNFSSQERFGTEDPVAILRIPQLNDSLKEILALVHQAENEGEQIEIHSEIILQRIKKDG